MLDSVLPGYEQDAADVVRKKLKNTELSSTSGIAQEWRETDDGVRVVTEPEDSQTNSYPGDRALISVGREP